MARRPNTVKVVESKESSVPRAGGSPFSDAAYSELARINGQINKMNKQALIQKLRNLRLSTEGATDVLKKRLKNHYKKKKLTTINVNPTNKLYPYYVIVDFEATCEEPNPPDYPHEIIEFPAVLVNTEKQEIADCFQAYCRPTVKPKLSSFCSELTGITQEQVDSAVTFPEVLSQFEDWLLKHELGTKYKYAIVTDGPWDMGKFLYAQCQLSGIPYPTFGKRWINIRKTFSNFYKSKRNCLKVMVEHLEIGFEGRPHCGIDDARNIARVLIHLILDGANIQVNERIHLSMSSNKRKFPCGDAYQPERRVLSVNVGEATKETIKCQAISEHKKESKGQKEDTQPCKEAAEGDEVLKLSAGLAICSISQSSSSSDESSS